MGQNETTLNFPIVNGAKLALDVIRGAVDLPEARTSAGATEVLGQGVRVQPRAEEELLNKENMELAYQLALKHGTTFIKDLTVLLIGAENTGKTSLISSFLGERFVENQLATNGAETQILKVYAKGWKRTTDSEKTSHVYGQFIHAVKNSAKEIAKTPVNEYGDIHVSSHIPFIIANPSNEDLPLLSAQDVNAMSSNDLQYDRESLNIIAWDYAGQVIFHNTHSVFMSENGVPIITFNASMELTDEIKPREGSPLPSECRTNISSIHYWLNTVNSMRPGNKSSQEPMALLAGTHIDLLHHDIKEARKMAKKKLLPQLEIELRNKPFLKQLIGNETGIMAYLDKYCFFVSNKYRDEELERLKSTVVDVAPSLKEKEPIIYLKIEQSLLLHKEQIITRSELHNIAIKCGFSVSEKSLEFAGLLSYLHSKRSILYFSEIELLKDLVILSPYWLAKLFSYVVTAHTYATGGEHDKAWERLNKYGILGGNLFAHMVQKFILDHPSAVKISADQVLEILLRFHLIARTTTNAWFTEEGFPPPDDFGDTFIVPSFMHHDDGKSPPNTKKERVIYFIFDSGFVPTNLLNQLIVECISRNVRMDNRLLWMRHCKVGLQLGNSQKYYISQYELDQRQGVQLTITADNNETNSVQERWELIQYIDQQLHDIITVFMPAEKKPKKCIPCPHCTKIHILFDAIGTTIYCPFNDDKKVPINYYTDLLLDSETGVCCSCTTVRTKIIQQYDQLTNLPIDNLLPQLVAKGVIDINDKQAIDNETKNSKKMMYLLDNVIISSLALGFPQKYNWFVAALNENDDLIARELSGRLPCAVSSVTTE
ncbi:uncharacterized protein [Dysidea avara]|uniref:uncharacterized protein isoform X2 n=1 Tax=Dysidea avara TaxID=196820 RepID=UPI00332FF53C